MNKIQYHHAKDKRQLSYKKRKTFAVVAPDRQQLAKAMSDMVLYGQGLVTFELGIALVHDKDKYVKKYGIEVANMNLQKVTGEVLEVTNDLDVLVFSIKVEKLYLMFKLSIDKTYSHLYGHIELS